MIISKAAYRYALKDALRPGPLIGWAAVALFVFLVGMIWHRLGNSLTPIQKFGQVSDVLVFRVIALTSALFSLGVLTHQLERKTAVYLLLRTMPRKTLLWSRMLASATAAAIASTVSLLAAGLAIFGPGLVTQSVFWFDLLLVVVGAMAYTSLFTMLSLIIRKPMVVMLLFAFGWENVTGDMGLISVLAYLRTLAPHPPINTGVMNILSGGDSTRVIAAPIAWLILLCITFGLAYLNGLLFENGEYVAHED